MNVRHDMVTIFVARPDETGRSHEFLQLRRAAGDYMGGTWQIIRGGVEAGETYVKAALRELLEETGLTPREFYRLGTIESFYTEADDTMWHSVAFCAIVDRKDGLILNNEHDAARWIPRVATRQALMWESERSLLSNLCCDILDASPAKVFLRIPPAS